MADNDQVAQGKPRTCPLFVSGGFGALGSVLVCIGASQPQSAFAVKLHAAWFFGIPRAPVGRAVPNDRLLAVALVYLGLILMVGAWFEIVRATRRQPGLTLRSLWITTGVWLMPIVIMPPLFSRDVYSYAAQGAMVSRGLNPYTSAPDSLGHNAYLRLVDPLWRHAHAPYGPAWERLSGWMVQLTGHNVTDTVAAFRLLALVGLALMAWGIPVLARSVGRPVTVAFALALLNPVVLLVLVGGAHNDALMLGLLVAGCALARRRQFVFGLVLVGLAAEVKIPALLGAAFIGWWWCGALGSWRRRLAYVAGALALSAGVMAVLSALSGFGWRWIDGLSNPGVVVSWLDPVTAVGLGVSHLASGLGLVGHQALVIDLFRGAGLLLAAGLAVWLLTRSERIGVMEALGWGLLAFVVLGPVIWPWYETWGFVFLAVVAEGVTLRILLGLSVLALFADVPSARVLFGAEPLLVVIVWLCLVALVTTYVAARIGPTLPWRETRPGAGPLLGGAMTHTAGSKGDSSPR